MGGGYITPGVSQSAFLGSFYFHYEETEELICKVGEEMFGFFSRSNWLSR